MGDSANVQDEGSNVFWLVTGAKNGNIVINLQCTMEFLSTTFSVQFFAFLFWIIRRFWEADHLPLP